MNAQAARVQRTNPKFMSIWRRSPEESVEAAQAESDAND